MRIRIHRRTLPLIPYTLLVQTRIRKAYSPTHTCFPSSLQQHHTWEDKDLRCHSRSSSPIFPVSELNEYNIPVADGVCDEEVRPVLPSCLAISCNILLPSSKIDLRTHTSPPSLPPPLLSQDKKQLRFLPKSIFPLFILCSFSPLGSLSRKQEGFYSAWKKSHHAPAISPRIRPNHLSRPITKIWTRAERYSLISRFFHRLSRLAVGQSIPRPPPFLSTPLFFHP